MDYSINDIKKEIERETRGVFSNRTANQIYDLVDLFISVLKIPIRDDSQNLDGLENRLMTAFNAILISSPNNTNRNTYFGDFVKIEPFLRKLLLLLKPEAYQIIKDQGKGLIQIINELGLNPQNKNLETLDLSRFENDIYHVGHLARSYKVRNAESHEINDWSSKDFGQFIQSFLVVYLNAIDKHKKALRDIVNSTVFVPEPSFTTYLDSIINGFKERAGRFIHLSSREDITLSGSYVTEYKLNESADTENAGREGTVETLRQISIPEKRMILWGEAGLGKSTTLEYLAYRDAMKRKNDSQQNLPIYISLGLLTDPDITIEQYICSKIGVDKSLGTRLLETGRLNIFLDGLNEIPKDNNSDLVTKRQRQIEYMIKTYKRCFIILTNRPEQINQFAEVPVFFIQKMNDDQIREFVKKYSEGKKAVEAKINGAIDGDERLKRIIKSPLMLSRLIEIVKADGEIPANEGLIIDRFIKSLYKREIIEKKDARFNDRSIHRLLAFLAAYSIEEKGTNAGLSENEILSVFLKCKKEYGFDIDLDYVVQISVQLNLLERHDDKFVFAHQSYQDYYNMEYERLILGI
jgi:hypothetical protein